MPHSSNKPPRRRDRARFDSLDGLIPGPLADHSRRLRGLTERVRAILPQDLASHCEVIGLADGILTLAVDSASWRTRFRFVEGDLLSRWPATDDRERPSRIRIKVVDRPSDPVHGRQAQPMSGATAKQIAAVAERIDHPGLAAALRRLSRRGRR